ncbi:MAG: CoA transferase [Firmicutes bacterium]|nr:CoA transferase [Bacillota bacterium]
MGKGLLNGLRVLDLTKVLSGPYCGMMLADLGADVIKVERPGTGDDSRANYPLKNGESGYFAAYNRNKRSVVLDLKDPADKEKFLKLVATSDVVLENNRPGVMDRLGLGFEDLKKVNPRIIFASISGFGQYGPYSQRAGYDIIAQALGGMMSVTGYPDGDPTRAGASISDVYGGLNCCIGILAAVYNREKTGEGERVDVALVDSMVSALDVMPIYNTIGVVPKRIGNWYESLSPYGAYNAKDGMLVIGGGNDKLFKLICEVMGQPEVFDDPRFATNMLRIQHNSELTPYIEKWLNTVTVDDAVKALLDAGVPAAPVNTVDKVAADPHVAGAREMFIKSEHPVMGEYTVVGCPIKLTNHPVTEYRPAPALGADNDSVFAEVCHEDN